MTAEPGRLCSEPKEVGSEARQRRQREYQTRIRHANLEEFLAKGWTQRKRFKQTVRLTKAKDGGHLFEDRVWLLFHRLGFQTMNVGADFKLLLRDGRPEQIDVVGLDDKHAFVVECKSSSKAGPIAVREKLERLKACKHEITEALRCLLAAEQIAMPQPHFLVVLSSRDKRPQDATYAQDKDVGIILWSAAELDYAERLAESMGQAARYQLYSILLQGKKASALNREYPCVEGKMGSVTFYSLFMPVRDVLEYAYVHHRGLSSIREATFAYQRMLKPGKLREIGDYVDSDGFFPNNIVLNFSHGLQFHRRAEGLGSLRLPARYGSAWVIDGQHRLYGAALSPKGLRGNIPVVAFHALTESEQATMFVEINKKQTAVPPDLLWDLYTDIYCDTETLYQKRKYQVSAAAKALACAEPFAGHVSIASIPECTGKDKKEANLKFTTLCTAVDTHAGWEVLRGLFKDEEMPERIALLLSAYFSEVRLLWPEDWNAGQEGCFRTNNGFGVLCLVFSDILENLAVTDRKKWLCGPRFRELRDLTRRYFTPVVAHLKVDRDQVRAIRENVGRGPQAEVAVSIEDTINREVDAEFRPQRLRAWRKERGEPETVVAAPPPFDLQAYKKRCQERTEHLSRKAEDAICALVLRKLQEQHDKSWWKRGIPSDLKEKADKRWQDEQKRLHPSVTSENPNVEKFNFLGLGDMLKVIVYRENWPAFEPVFRDTREAENNLSRINDVRNPQAHPQRTVKPEAIAFAMPALQWLSRCLGDPEFDPEREDVRDSAPLKVDGASPLTP